MSNRASTGALEQPRARPIPPGGRVVSRAGVRAASASACAPVSAGALGQSRAGPISPGNRAVTRAGGRAASASAPSCGLASSVGSTASAGTSRSDDLFLIAALRRSGATALTRRWRAMKSPTAIWYGLSWRLRRAWTRSNFYPRVRVFRESAVEHVGPNSSGCSRWACALASAGLRHATGSGGDWRRAFANRSSRRRTQKLPPPRPPERKTRPRPRPGLIPPPHSRWVPGPIWARSRASFRTF